MTATFLCPALRQQFFAPNGQFLSYGTVWTYEGGTTTPIATFVDSTGTTQNTNPIILDAYGSCSIWLEPNVSYKVSVFDQNGNQLPGYPVDQIVDAALLSIFGGIDTGVSNAYIVTYSSPVPNNTTGTVIYWLPSNSNTGPSTLNANGGGPAPIQNPNGTPLGANQILAGQFVSTIYLNGIWQLYGGSGVGSTVGTFGAEQPVAAATTTDLGSVSGHNASVIGSATITSFGTSAQLVAPIYIGRFTGTNTLTNSAALILPGGNNITTSPSDAFIAEYMGSGNWRVLFYQYAGVGSGLAGNAAVKAVDTAITSNATLTADPDLQLTLLTGQYEYELFMLFDSVGAGAGFKFQSMGTAVDSRGTSPAIASGLVNATAYGPKLESFVGGTITYSTIGISDDSNGVLYKGSLLLTTAGTFGIEWAQAVSTASATTLRAGSYLTANLLAQKNQTGTLTRIYTTATTAFETIPAGYTNCLIEGGGASAGGGTKFTGGSGTTGGGGGGGSGAYFRTTISVAGQGGNTMQYTVGAAGAFDFNGGNSSVSSGTFSISTLTAGGGVAGGGATTVNNPGPGGAGGVASGGTINTPGNPGNSGLPNTGGGTGGAGGAGLSGINYGGANGGRGDGIFLPGTAGGVGYIVFQYS
jgi:hypothetical protein